jgi:dTDP-glucose pyrophosphorylase
MIYHVLENFKHVGYKYVLMQKSHIDKYNALDILRHKCSDLDIIEVNGLTEGAACTVLLAKQYFDNNNELVLANSDQYVDTDIMAFVNDMRDRDADAGILTFKSDDPKWSYAKIGFEGYVTEVVEKKVISDQATVGIYYYRHGREFVKYAEQMIRKNIRTNNEFYVCPIFNEFIADGKKICIYEIPEYNMYGLGTPEDLKEFVKNG